MISLQPQENFAIARQLADHTDATTYYVQAVVRKSVTNEIINTVRLTDYGDGRFLKTWEVPADVGGLGFFIDITTSVYSDSGYTTKATTYGDEMEEYLVFDRIKGSGGGSGGADIDVDYKKIEKILVKTIEPLKEKEKIDLGPVLDEIKGVMSAVRGIEIPKIEKADFSSIEKAVRGVEKVIIKAIDDKEVTKVPNLENLLEIITKKDNNLSVTYAKIADLKTAIDKFVETYLANAKNIEDSAQRKLEKISSALLPIVTEIEPQKINSNERSKKLLG
jgi:hypothetical protein